MYSLQNEGQPESLGPTRAEFGLFDDEDQDFARLRDSPGTEPRNRGVFDSEGHDYVTLVPSSEDEGESSHQRKWALDTSCPVFLPDLLLREEDSRLTMLAQPRLGELRPSQDGRCQQTCQKPPKDDATRPEIK